MKRLHYAIVLAEVLSYALIVTFIFADTRFDLTGALRIGGPGLSPEMALVAACLVTLVGTINVWLTVYYMEKSQTMRDWVVICAWTHRIKSGNQWLTLEDFLTRQLGCQISHGLSEDAFHQMRDELDARWRTMRPDTPRSGASPAPEGQLSPRADAGATPGEAAAPGP